MSLVLRNSFQKVIAQSGQVQLAILAFVLFQLLILLQVGLAYQDSFLTLDQMRQRGIERGLPLLWHLGIWSDAILISALAAVMVRRFSDQWSRRALWIAVALAVGFAILLGWLFTLSSTPEANVQHHRTTPAGFAHLLYTS